MLKIFYILLLTCSFATSQRIDFDKEDIAFYLDSKYFKVVGNYWFSNQTTKTVETEIYYPFPHTAGEEIDSIIVYNLTAIREIAFASEDNYGISFYLNIEPKDTVLYQIKYRQKINSDSAVYILKSTRSWNKPLESAIFKLITPVTLKLTNFSYAPDETYEFENLKIYVWRKEYFMPTRNMVFYF